MYKPHAGRASPSRWSATPQCEEAAAAAERALALSGRHSWALTTLVSIYAAWDKPENARAVYRELEARSARLHSTLDASTRSRRGGEMDRAIAFAQEALDDKDPLFVMLARTWPGDGRLRIDSRFLEIDSHLALPGWNLQREQGAMLNQCV